MKHLVEDTIAAIATPLGVGGVGIVRISGHDAKNLLARLFLSSNGTEFSSHIMLHGWICDPSSGEKADQVLACFMRSPKSYTGEDVVEFYCHGGMAVVSRVLDLSLANGARIAQKGEFTKRAFLNGKVDLAQAEAVLDLIQAPTASSAGFAVNQLEGRLSKEVSGMRAKLLGLLAELEAEIDFPDDVAALNLDGLKSKLEGLVKEIDGLLKNPQSGRIYREGLATVILGKPNVGKSSLLNVLLGETRAIVTEVPGTTRDAIEERVCLSGLPLRIIDTAGLRHPIDRVEELGVKRTEKELSSADLALVVIDASKELDDLDKMVMSKARSKRAILVLNKIDLVEKVDLGALCEMAEGAPVFKTSALLGQGINELGEGIFAYVRNEFKLPEKDSVTINARHRECLQRASEGIARAAQACRKKLASDFITIDIKEAVVALGEITGELVSEEVINNIFAKFCVGK